MSVSTTASSSRRCRSPMTEAPLAVDRPGPAGRRIAPQLRDLGVDVEDDQPHVGEILLVDAVPLGELVERARDRPRIIVAFLDPRLVRRAPTLLPREHGGDGVLLMTRRQHLAEIGEPLGPGVGLGGVGHGRAKAARRVVEPGALDLATTAVEEVREQLLTILEEVGVVGLVPARRHRAQPRELVTAPALPALAERLWQLLPAQRRGRARAVAARQRGERVVAGRQALAGIDHALHAQTRLAIAAPLERGFEIVERSPFDVRGPEPAEHGVRDERPQRPAPGRRQRLERLAPAGRDRRDLQPPAGVEIDQPHRRAHPPA